MPSSFPSETISLMHIPNKFIPPIDPYKLLNIPNNTPKAQQLQILNELKKNWHPDKFATLNLTKQQTQYINDRFIWLMNQKSIRKPIILVPSQTKYPKKTIKSKNRNTVILLCGVVVIGMVAQYKRFQYAFNK